MRTLTLSTLVAVLVGCGSSPASGDDDDDDIPPPDDVPPFTSGVSMLSGHADAGLADGARGVARFANPVNVAVGPDGAVYVADFDNSKIRIVDATDGTTRTYVDGLRRPFGMAFATDGTLYVTTDRNASTSESGPMTGTIWRIVEGVATIVVENVGRPRGIVALPDGNLAVSDYQHHVIEVVDPTRGSVRVLAGAWDMPGTANGSGGAARFASPYGIALVDGALVVADHENHGLRHVTLTGKVTTFAGGGAGFADGPLADARFTRPLAVATSAGDLFVTDTGNFRVRRIRDGVVETIAGSGLAGYLDHDDPLQAELYGLEGVATTTDGTTVFLADGSRGEALPYNRIRIVDLD